VTQAVSLLFGKRREQRGGKCVVALILRAQSVKRGLLHLFSVHVALQVVKQKKKPRRGCVAARLAERRGKTLTQSAHIL